MFYLSTDFIAASPFMPHGMCYLWKPDLIGLHLVSNAIISLSYFSIPFILLEITRRREDLPFDGIFFLFAAFILSCGIGHLMDIWTLWHPNYWISGTIRGVTAIVSLITAIALSYLTPEILALPSKAQIEQTNQLLVQEIEERKQIELKIQHFNQELEAQVKQRTQELEITNHLKDDLFIRERQAKEAIKIYEDIVKNIPIGLSIWYLENVNDLSSFKLVEINPKAAKLLQINRENSINKRMIECFPNVLDYPHRYTIEAYAEVVHSQETKILDNIIYGDSRLSKQIYKVGQGSIFKFTWMK